MISKVSIQDIEAVRQSEQMVLDRAKHRSDRNRLGQFATPNALAIEILAITRSYLAERTDVKFLDPAVGTGSFFSALLAAFPIADIRSATGFELDAEIAYMASKLWNQ